jgi:hypothetical protein
MTSGRCVECVKNGDCSLTSGGPICSTETHTCVQCATNGDCSASTPYCSPTARRCVRCLAHSHCTSPGQMCNANGQCAYTIGGILDDLQ